MNQVVAAAIQLINNIDADKLALFFGTLHEESDPAVKVNNESKEALIMALNEKAVALHAIYLVRKCCGHTH